MLLDQTNSKKMFKTKIIILKTFKVLLYHKKYLEFFSNFVQYKLSIFLYYYVKFKNHKKLPKNLAEIESNISKIKKFFPYNN